MITAGDDFPIHQTPEPVQQVFTGDRNFYDRFYFNGCWREGEPYFAFALGVYPNLGIVDAAFNAIVDGVQHCLRASRLLGADRLDTRAGPIRVEIVKPLTTFRIVVEHEAVKADLVFEARAGAIEEPRYVRRQGPRVIWDSTRFVQHGAWSGAFTIGGRRFAAAPDRVWGVRDRSWGIRPVGEREPMGAPPAELPQFFFLWSPQNFEDSCLHFTVSENADGTRWAAGGALCTARPRSERNPSTGLAQVPRIEAVEWKIDYRPGTRHARAAEITLHAPDGRTHRVNLEVLYNFYMQGLGYLHPKWGHGMFVGPAASEYESFPLAGVDESNLFYQHIEAITRARFEGREGVGILEMLSIGPHRPSGFTSLLDMHP